jgi:hypothetical protein
MDMAFLCFVRPCPRSEPWPEYIIIIIIIIKNGHPNRMTRDSKLAHWLLHGKNSRRSGWSSTGTI